MILLLLFLLGWFVYGVVTSERIALRPGPVTVLAICLVVAVAYTSRRFI